MKNLRLKTSLVCLFSLVIVTTVNCNILSRNAKNIYQENDGTGKEMVYVVLNVGRIVGNIVFAMDDDLLLNTPKPIVDGQDGKSPFWSDSVSTAIYIAVLLLFLLTIVMVFKWKSGTWFDRREKVKSP